MTSKEISKKITRNDLRRIAILLAIAFTSLAGFVLILRANGLELNNLYSSISDQPQVKTNLPAGNVNGIDVSINGIDEPWNTGIQSTLVLPPIDTKSVWMSIASESNIKIGKLNVFDGSFETTLVLPSDASNIKFYQNSAATYLKPSDDGSQLIAAGALSNQLLLQFDEDENIVDYLYDVTSEELFIIKQLDDGTQTIITLVGSGNQFDVAKSLSIRFEKFLFQVENDFMYLMGVDGQCYKLAKVDGHVTKLNSCTDAYTEKYLLGKQTTNFSRISTAPSIGRIFRFGKDKKVTTVATAPAGFLIKDPVTADPSFHIVSLYEQYAIGGIYSARYKGIYYFYNQLPASYPTPTSYPTIETLVPIMVTNSGTDIVDFFMQDKNLIIQTSTGSGDRFHRYDEQDRALIDVSPNLCKEMSCEYFRFRLDLQFGSDFEQ